MKIYIKNMVCDRCKWVVESELLKLGLQPVSIALGEVELQEEISANQKKDLIKVLQTHGFDFITDYKSKFTEKIKNLIINIIYKKDNHLDVNLSVFLSNELQQDYHVLSNYFTDLEGTTIEKYYILQKIERIKELLVYNELSLSQIAHLLNYSSVAYLSNQFKKVTGVTPTEFKLSENKHRKALDGL
jgi:YesN/AraC family two-component response regulator